MYRRITLDAVLKSELHKPYIYSDEIEQLQHEFGDFPCYYAVLQYSQEHWQHWQGIYNVQKDRRGEIAVNIQNNYKKVLLHTKPFYPAESYRIPTGGIKLGERVLDGLDREVFEETGFQIIKKSFAGILLYEFQHKGDLLPFTSYIFNITPDKQIPVVQDLTENISDFKWVDQPALKETIEHLTSLQGDRWPDWGRMRAIPHLIILDNFI